MECFSVHKGSANCRLFADTFPCLNINGGHAGGQMKAGFKKRKAFINCFIQILSLLSLSSPLCHRSVVLGSTDSLCMWSIRLGHY